MKAHSGRKRLGAALAVFAAVFFFGISANADGKEKSRVKGDFRLSGFLSVAAGWQHFSRDAVTEIADDGSSGGPIGEWIPNTLSGIPPSPGQDTGQAFVPDLQLNVAKHFNENVRLYADMKFGRLASGSMMPGARMAHAYAAVRPFKEHDFEILVGRIGLPPGFEPVQMYFNDTISYSILWRGMITPGALTGIVLSSEVSDGIKLYFGAGNGVIHDFTIKGNELPCFMGILEVDWGSEARPSSFIFAPAFGPESGENRPLSFGANMTMTWWLNEKWQLGLEADFQRDNAAGGTNTSYYGGLVNLHWEPVHSWYTYLKYVHTYQSAAGNGVINRTGAKQNINEMSAGFGHFLADGVVLKVEGRGDIVVPATSATQWVAGAAMAMEWAF